MTRIRKWLIGAVVALTLLLPLASTVSAAPGDGGIGRASPTRTASDPGDGGIGK